MIWRILKIWFRFLWLNQMRYDYGFAATQAKHAEAESQRSMAATAARRQQSEYLKWQAELAQQKHQFGTRQQSFKQMIDEYNRAYGTAATGEEKRYQEILGIADRTTGQRAADIRADYTEQQSTAMQRLARLGMANTTVAPTMKMGFQREQQSALNRLADQMQQTQIGVRERRPSRFPETGMITSMAQLLR